MTKEDEGTTSAVPEGSPDSNEKAESKKPSVSRKKPYLVLAAIALLVAIVLCIALPLTLKDSGDSSASTDSSTSDAELLDSVAEDTSRQPEDAGEDSTTGGMGGGVTGTVFSSLLGTLPLFGSDITAGYQTQADLEGAIKIALRQEAQRIIDRNVRSLLQYGDGNGYGGRPEAMPMDGQMTAMEGDTAEQDMAAMPESAATGDAGTGDEGVTDFGTNNQEENIDEADVIKADANFIYAAYGDYIIVWDTNGNQVAQVKMPPVELPEDWGKPEAEVARQKSVVLPPDYNYRPKPSIQSMLLTDNHLVVMVHGYNEDYSWWGPSPLSMSEQPRKMLNGHRACQIRLYQKTSSGDLNFVGSRDTNGYYVDARSIGDTVHLASSANVDTWTSLGRPLDYYNIANNTKLSVEEYQQKANRIADEIVPQATQVLLDELKLENGEFPNMLQVNQWFTQVNDTSDGGAGFDLPEPYNVISNMAQVTSFNVNNPLEQDGLLSTSASAFLSPAYVNTLYGTDEHLVLATAGWDWNAVRGEGEQTTYLVALQISGDSTEFLSVGTLKGHLLNQYALDIVGNELRAATTIERFRWWWGSGPIMPVDPMPMDDAEVAEEEVAPVATTEARNGGRRSLQVEEQCGPAPDTSDLVDDCVTPEAYEECAVLVEKGCSLIQKTDEETCPYTYECAIVGRDDAGLCPPVEDIERDTCLNAQNMQECINLSDQGCPEISVLESCPVQFRCNAQALADMDPDGLCPTTEDDECVNDMNYLNCVQLVEGGCTEIMWMESCPLQFSCAVATTSTTNAGDEPTGDDPAVDEPIVRPPEQEDDDESRTENYMVVLKLAGDGVPEGQMLEKGRVQVGLKNERITSVRFFDNIAYVVTFEQTDPFYVVDMSVPRVLGELKLPGFSSYLHSMNADNTLLLAVGQNATSDGRQLGLMVTVFDATDASDPRALVSHTFEQDEDAYSGSSVQWDYKAFRYVDGKLVVPMELWYQQEWDPETGVFLPLPEGVENFRGFAVLDIDVSARSITELYRVSHMKPEACYYCGGYLPQRSFVYNGDLITIRENYVVSTDFESGERNWSFVIQVEGETAECCY